MVTREFVCNLKPPVFGRFQTEDKRFIELASTKNDFQAERRAYSSTKAKRQWASHGGMGQASSFDDRLSEKTKTRESTGDTSLTSSKYPDVCPLPASRFGADFIRFCAGRQASERARSLMRCGRVVKGVFVRTAATAVPHATIFRKTARCRCQQAHPPPLACRMARREARPRFPTRPSFRRSPRRFWLP